ncbi:WD40 repeat domain-containing protein [Botryobacter ruber]|uniref:PD40 domain-containing protein n=1 Tax=Botryobacter ruber TaxID=2171629 RepID=UPI000E0C714E|nr:PD40 domain-containing protein [Botryobacter ruber]
MNRIQTLALAVVAILVTLPALAQKETANWFFGNNAAVSFASDSGVVVTKARLTTEEGSASLSDKDGNLLFYNNGITVWNRDHRVMPNGNRLMGHKSSTQSALILPKPGNDSIYYIFTTDVQAQSNGLRYSIVNLNKQGGKGDVVSRNNIMLMPATEKLTAVRHSNNRDYWVIAHRWNSDAYHAYLVSSDGVSIEPIISNVGAVHGGSNKKAIGYLKPSPDGTRLAAALWNDTSSVELLNFNRGSGQLSNPIALEGLEEAYGVAFSPDGSKLYVTANGKGGGNAQIVQYDLRAGSAAGIAASATVVGRSVSRKLGALQLAPDGKIYVARKNESYLGVIQVPNQRGEAAGYVDKGLYLGGQKSDMGLPNFPQGLEHSSIQSPQRYLTGPASSEK